MNVYLVAKWRYIKIMALLTALKDIMISGPKIILAHGCENVAGKLRQK